MSELLIVLGKNISVGSSPEDIRQSPDHLSDDSRISALAAGIIYESSSETDVLFSTGYTAGLDVPAESTAMKAFTQHHYPNIAQGRLFTEEKSIDTRTNAIEVSQWLNTRPDYDRINLMSVSFHILNAAKLFRRHGVPIDGMIASDEVLRERSEGDEVFVDEWLGSERIAMEIQKEKVRSLLLATIDPRGRLLHAVTQRSRG